MFTLIQINLTETVLVSNSPKFHDSYAMSRKVHFKSQLNASACCALVGQRCETRVITESSARGFCSKLVWRRVESLGLRHCYQVGPALRWMRWHGGKSRLKINPPTPLMCRVACLGAISLPELAPILVSGNHMLLTLAQTKRIASSGKELIQAFR